MGILGQKSQFWAIFGQKGAIFEFSVKKRKRHFFTHFFHFSILKSENSNARSFGKMGTYVRAYGRKDRGESKGPPTPSRDQNTS